MIFPIGLRQSCQTTVKMKMMIVNSAKECAGNFVYNAYKIEEFALKYLSSISEKMKISHFLLKKEKVLILIIFILIILTVYIKCSAIRYAR